MYDQGHQVQAALLRHDRAAAETTAAAMESSAPGHRLTFWARRSLAYYDADPSEGLACVEKLLALFPDDPGLLLAKIGSLRALGRRDRHVQGRHVLARQEHQGGVLPPRRNCKNTKALAA